VLILHATSICTFSEADLDTDCILPYDSIFGRHNVSMLKYTEESNHITFKIGSNGKEESSQRE